MGAYPQVPGYPAEQPGSQCQQGFVPPGQMAYPPPDQSAYPPPPGYASGPAQPPFQPLVTNQPGMGPNPSLAPPPGSYIGPPGLEYLAMVDRSSCESHSKISSRSPIQSSTIRYFRPRCLKRLSNSNDFCGKPQISTRRIASNMATCTSFFA